jgi:DNA-binding NtrC family response regulator
MDSSLDTPTILFVDDEKSLIELARHALKADGCEVLGAETADSALDLFARHHAELDAVFVDLVLPDMEGAELVERLTEIDESVPLIITSGHGCERASQALDAGAVGFLGKPFDVGELRAALDDVE